MFIVTEYAALTIYLLKLSADNFYKKVLTQIRPDKTWVLIWVQTVHGIPKFWKKLIFKKNQQMTKEHAKLPSWQGVDTPLKCIV